MLLSGKFFMLAQCQVQNGSTVSFWNDTWNLGVLKQKFPQLHYFALNEHISVSGFLQIATNQVFWLPLSLEASAQLTILQQGIQELHLLPEQKDQWTYIWGSAVFASKKAYLQIIGHRDTSPWFTWLWNSCCRSKHFCLLVRDRLNTRDLLRRKTMFLDSYTCVLCNSAQDETLLHHFFECLFSRWCWGFLTIDWNVQLSPNDMLLFTPGNSWIKDFQRNSNGGSVVYLVP